MSTAVPVSERIVNIMKMLADAEKRYNGMSTAVNDAQILKEEALKHLNGLQKEMNDCIQTLKENAPYSSNWSVET